MEEKMSIKPDLTQHEQLLLRPVLGDAGVEYCFPFDLNERESYVDGKLVITKERLVILCDGEIIGDMRIDAGKDYKMRENGSSGMLEYTDTAVNAEKRLLYFTLNGLTRFAYAESILNAYSEHKPVTIYDKTGLYTDCPVCKTKFIHNTRTCPKCNNKLGLIKRLAHSARETWVLYIFMIIVIALTSLIALINPVIFRHLIDNVIRPMEAYSSQNYEILQEGVSPRAPALTPIVSVVLMLAAASLIRVCFNITREFIATAAGGRMVRNFRSLVYGKINELSIKFLDTKQAGDLMNRVNHDTERIRAIVNGFLIPFINELFIMFAVIGMIMIYDWKLGLVVLAPVPFVIFFLSRVNFRKRYHAQWVKMDKLNSTLNNILSGIRVVKAFGQERREIERFCGDAAVVRDITTRNEKFFYTLFPMVRFTIGIGNYFVLLYCGTRILNMNMSIGQLVQFSAYAEMLYGRLGYFTSMPRHLSDMANAATRMFEVVDENIETSGDTLVEHDITGAVDVSNMTFGYLSYKPVLKNLNLHIKQGEMIGIVGHSGAGKSTFINLLMRLYEADEGGITIDGLDLQSLSVQGYKNQIGVVLQEPFLFSGTVWDNIKYSKPEATFEEIITAAKIANAHDFITQLPNGYDTKVGEKGHSLSGGERQRVSIARAVLNDPKILILDEATASVDTETEAAIQQAFSRLIKGRTTFAIAHRLSTLKNADRIMVIDKGELKEFGSHKELMEISEGIYRGLVMAQRQMSKIKAI
jgi:ATP-binding cassette subfamily B protein